MLDRPTSRSRMPSPSKSPVESALGDDPMLETIGPGGGFVSKRASHGRSVESTPVNWPPTISCVPLTAIEFVKNGPTNGTLQDVGVPVASSSSATRRRGEPPMLLKVPEA